MARLGLSLIGVVAWASEQMSRKREQPFHYLLAGAGYVALAGVTVIGVAVDGMFPIPKPLRSRKSARVESRAGESMIVGRGSPVA